MFEDEQYKLLRAVFGDLRLKSLMSIRWDVPDFILWEVKVVEELAAGLADVVAVCDRHANIRIVNILSFHRVNRIGEPFLF